MTRDIAKRLAQIESHVWGQRHRFDLTELTDRQLELLEGCIDRVTGQWKEAALADLSEADIDLLSEALKVIEEQASGEIAGAVR